MILRRIVESSGYCGKCLKQVPIRSFCIRNWPHLILTLLTAGLWVIYWIIDSRKAKLNQQWLCMRCGSEVYKIMSHIDI
jgi:hypothetical protein